MKAHLKLMIRGNIGFSQLDTCLQHTQNGELIAISSELAAKYNVRLLSLYKHQKKILSQERRGIFIRHFQ
ncbi:hypothetical protein C4E44_26580 [Pseudomonas sp. MWU12-2312b]|nr:hypothetical protein C4E44_26580 [Pseudomonas sp. MWU12-2312b]